ncbi:MAG: 3D domain-containing protein [Methylacidiphilales bacterium]|nr:3D domain-containing protein [Candidatus Methylacidiphilales bacterium]
MTRYFYNICFIVLCLSVPARAVVGPHCPVDTDAEMPAKKTVAASSAHKDKNHKNTKTASTAAKTTGSPAKIAAGKVTHSTESVAKDKKSEPAPFKPEAAAVKLSHPCPSVASTKGPHSSEPTATSARASGLGSTDRLASASSFRSSGSFSHTDGGRLARLTAYWSGEGDYYTGRGLSATGVRLHDGLCAVDPSIIPYGSVVEITGLGRYLAVDTGSAVISREAAREAAHNAAERNALVIDIYFESSRDGQQFAANGPKYAPIRWWTPTAANSEAKQARSLFADEDWTRIQSKQL